MPSGKIKVKNPCHPAYAARTIYQEDGYDFLILVEDFLAKRIIQEIIDNNKSIDNNKLNIYFTIRWLEGNIENT